MKDRFTPLHLGLIFLVLFSLMEVGAGGLEQVSLVLPVFDKLSGPLQFLGRPGELKRVKDRLYFQLFDGSGALPCVMNLEKANFTLDDILWISGHPEGDGRSRLLVIDLLEAVPPSHRGFHIVSVAAAKGAGTGEVVALVGVYLPPEGTEKDNLNFFLIEDASGKMALEIDFLGGFSFNEKHHGYPIKIIGRHQADGFKPLHLVRLDEGNNGVRYRILRDIFQERRERFLNFPIKTAK